MKGGDKACEELERKGREANCEGKTGGGIIYKQKKIAKEEPYQEEERCLKVQQNSCWLMISKIISLHSKTIIN